MLQDKTEQEFSEPVTTRLPACSIHSPAQCGLLHLRGAETLLGGPAVSTCQSTRHLRLLSPVSVHTQGLTTSTQRTEDTSEVQHFSESPSVLANHLQTTIYSSNLHLISVHKQIIVSMKLLIARNYAANISVYVSPANCLQQVLFPYSQPEI